MKIPTVSFDAEASTIHERTLRTGAQALFERSMEDSNALPVLHAEYRYYYSDYASTRAAEDLIAARVVRDAG